MIRGTEVSRVPAGERGMDLVLAEAKRRGVAVLAEAKRRGVAVLAVYDAPGRFLRWSTVPWPR